MSLWTSKTQQAQQDELHRSALGLLATEQSISDGEAIRAGVLGMAVALALVTGVFAAVAFTSYRLCEWMLGGDTDGEE